MRKPTEADNESRSWIDQESAGCAFADARLEQRFGMLVSNLADGMGESIPMACQDWAATKAAYRFFSNERVSGHRSYFALSRGFTIRVGIMAVP
jgi:hypothetical protein